MKDKYNVEETVQLPEVKRWAECFYANPDFPLARKHVYKTHGELQSYHYVTKVAIYSCMDCGAKWSVSQ